MRTYTWRQWVVIVVCVVFLLAAALYRGITGDVTPL
jgi:hypothetical protein